MGIQADARLGLRDLADALGDEGAQSPAHSQAYLEEIEGRRHAWAAEAMPNYHSDEQPIHNARYFMNCGRAYRMTPLW